MALTTFIMFRMVVYIYASVDDPKLETTFSVFVFTLVLRMFDISFDKVDEGVHRVSKVEKELYEIALDIYMINYVWTKMIKIKRN